MPKQSRFLCIGGFLNGTQVKDQGDSFICVENGKQVTYRKMEIFHQDAWDQDYYVYELKIGQDTLGLFFCCNIYNYRKIEHYKYPLFVFYSVFL